MATLPEGPETCGCFYGTVAWQSRALLTQTSARPAVSHGCRQHRTQGAAPKLAQTHFCISGKTSLRQFWLSRNPLFTVQLKAPGQVSAFWFVSRGSETQKFLW